MTKVSTMVGVICLLVGTTVKAEEVSIGSEKIKMIQSGCRAMGQGAPPEVGISAFVLSCYQKGLDLALKGTRPLKIAEKMCQNFDSSCFLAAFQSYQGFLHHSTTDDSGLKRAWGLKHGAPHETVVAIIAVGLAPEAIAAQVEILAQGNTPLKEIIIELPDQNVDALVADLQQRFPAVSISAQYAK